MKKINKPEAHCFTIACAARAADTTPEVMAACLRKLCLSPDASGEINLSLLFYAVRLRMDPNRPRRTANPAVEARQARRILRRWFGAAKV